MSVPTLTREMVAQVRARCVSVRDDSIDRGIVALCDLATAYLDAPERDLTPSQRATWGVCPACLAKHGETCYREPPYPDRMRPEYVHSARLASAPLRVRLVPVGGERGT